MITLDYQSKDPIYQQVKERIAELIMLGVYEPGTQLPSVRSLATELGINPNTIQKAYQELDAEGVIYSVFGKGSFAAEASNARRMLQKRAARELQELLRQLHLAGMPEEQLTALVRQEYHGEAEQ